MTKPTSNPRCKCCDEVMDEMLTMRQTFEKLFHRLTSQVVDLRRNLNGDEEHSSSSKKIELSGRRSRRRSLSSEPPRRKSKFSDDSDSEMEIIQPITFDNSSDTDLVKSTKKTSKKRNVLSAEQQSTKGNIHIENVKNIRQPVSTFFKVKGPVMPKKPFTEAQQFEDWNAVLVNDEDQREQLRAELLKGTFDEPDRYIQYVWRTLLKNEAAEKYSYRGNGRCKKKAIKTYVFTDIFLECFLQRYHHMDNSFFVERTMRYFNYAHDHMRKLERELQRAQKSEEKIIESTVETSLDTPKTYTEL